MSKILFIGAGNMGEAIINGIIKNNCYKKEDIYIYEINETRKQKVMEQYGVSHYKKIDKDISQFDIIILAIKPQTFLLLEEDKELINLKKFVTERETIVSIMAGITINKIKKILSENTTIVRVMPNTPALIGMSMSIISPEKNLSNEKIKEVKKIFDSIGQTEIMEEKYINAVTALSGSGPAYLFMFIEALTEAGILIGLSKDIAEKLAIETISGSIAMAKKERENKTKTIEDLKYMVSSPAGTTINAIKVLEKKGFKGIIMDAVYKAFERANELGKD